MDDLVFRGPDCPGCGTETDTDGTSWWCGGCGATWDYNGENGRSGTPNG